MATKTFKVALSLDNPRIIQSGIDVRSFDKQSIKIEIELTKNSQTYQIPTGAQIKISLIKLARQEQKIILDVPFTSADSIDWVVPDYLDGYQGEVRVGIYLIVGTENIDVGYFNIMSSVSDIDKAAEEFTESIMQGWDQIEADLAEIRATITQVNTLASDFTTDVATKQTDVTSKYNAFDTSVTTANQTIDDILALQPQFQSVLDETTGKDVISAPEIILARGGATTLGERLDKNDVKLTQIANVSSPTYQGILGEELIDDSGWIIPDGWTGNVVDGFKKITGNTNQLKKTISLTGTKLFQIAFRVESPTPSGVPNASTDFTVSIGNSEPFVTYQGGGNFDYTFGIQSVSDGDLIFSPGTTFDGTIKNISVKEIVGEYEALTQIKDENGNIFREERATLPLLNNIFIGKGSGQINISGRENVALGDLSLSRNTSGYWNNAIGKQALEANTTGSRNVAMGFYALKENISGDRNIAIGTYTLQRNTHGRQNIAMGADALWVNTTGSRNIAFGMGTMGSSVSGNENIAIGYAVMERNIDGNGNIGIGFNALYENVSSHNNIAIGREALKKTKVAINIGIGFGTLTWNTEGASNIAIGVSALSRSKLGSENAVFGHYAAAGGAYGDGISQSTIFGAWAGNKLTTGGNNNTLIGFGAGKELTTGFNNIMLGRNAGVGLTTESNTLVIGDLLYGRLNTSNKQFGIGVTSPTARLHISPSNGGAGSAPIKIDAGSLLAVKEAGTIEYNGTDLYFTNSAGVRYKLAKEPV